MEIIDSTIFKALVNKCTCDTGDDTDTIGFSGTHNNYSINFYWDESGFVLEECVSENIIDGKSSYKEYNLNDEQIDVLKGVIIKRQSFIHEQQRDQEYNDQLEHDHINWLHSACGYGR